MNTTCPAPSTLSLIRVPAAITLGVTLLRLVLELAGGPAWLASNAAGGAGAVLGIVWLPLIFGPWFALRIRPHVAGTWPLVRRLARTLLLYGLAARIPVALITIPAVLGTWGTHYDSFGAFTGGSAARIAVAFGAQLLFWACVWTVVVGTVAGLIAHLVAGMLDARRRAATVGGASGPG